MAYITVLEACTAVRGKGDYDAKPEDFRFPVGSKTYIYVEMKDVAKGGKVSWLFYRKKEGKWEYTHTGEWVIPGDWTTCWCQCWKTNHIAGEKLCEVYYNGKLVGKKTYFAGPEVPPPKPRRIIGKVTDKTTGTAIKIGTVTFFEKTVVIGADGKYVMDDPPEYSGPLVCKAAGYKDQEKKITAPLEGDLTVNFSMEPTEVVPEYRVLPDPPVEWTDEQKNIYKRLDEACYMKDKVGVIDVLRIMADMKASPIAFLGIVLSIKAVALAIVAVISAVGFAQFLFEETLQKYESAIFSAQSAKMWDIAKEAELEYEEFKNRPIWLKIGEWIPFVGIIVVVDEYKKASDHYLETSKKITDRKLAYPYAPTPGDFYKAVEEYEAGRDWEMYVRNATRLIINSSPSGAGIEISPDGMSLCCTPFEFIPIAPGTYTVKVFMEGYKDESRVIEVPAGYTITEDFYLKSEVPPVKASIEVITRPDGADVFVNDVLFTYPSNTVIEDLEAGAYMIRVEKTGYESTQKRITVGEGEHRKTEFDLVPIEVPPEKGILSARSSPSGAEVIIEGTSRGLTPIDLDLDPGSYSVTFFLEGYEELTRTTIIKKGETTVLSVTLEEEEEVPPKPPLPPPGKAHIIIDVTPAYTELWLGAELLGTLPPPGHYESEMDPGTYDFTFKKEGYYDTTRTAVMRADQTTTLSVSLIKIPSKKKVWRVDVSAVDTAGYPLSAKILVNDSFTGKWTPDYVLLDPGDYEFTITKSGYIPAVIPLSLEVIE